MTKTQLRNELFGIKNALRDAMLDQIAMVGNDATKDALYIAVWQIWKRMNQQDYK